jgi:cytochrome c oxidase subunit 3
MSLAISSLEAYRFQLRSNRLGLWFFFVSEAFMFGGLLVARFYLWRDADHGIIRPDLDQILGLIITSILLLSSWFMNLGETALVNNDRKTFLISLPITALLGLTFLTGVVVFEWGGHIRPSDGAFGAVLYGMTGMHALHVLSGVIFIFIVWLNGLRGRFSPERHWGVEACAIWWHYVDLVWVFFYPAIYLMGTAVHG